jgi:hypothetical protein
LRQANNAITCATEGGIEEEPHDLHVPAAEYGTHEPKQKHHPSGRSRLTDSKDRSEKLTEKKEKKIENREELKQHIIVNRRKAILA